MNDSSKLKDQVEENLFQDKKLADFPIEVLNNNGVITLAGEVSTEEFSQAAETVARQTEGVFSVINQIAINKNVTRSPQLIIRPS
jgi:osmotically-inducible protein OsmY